MTKIQIDRLRLENFKCHRHLDLHFDGHNAVIYGDNGVGKTSVYDALTWLLFGKDSSGQGEKTIEVKPLTAAGAVADREAATSVESVLTVDGNPIALKKIYREMWSKKRGGVEVYEGNVGEYFIDGVPCKKTAYEKRISEIVPEDVFRLLTSVSYFPRDLHWMKRREILFALSSHLSDREIMAKDSRFLPLSQAVGNLSLEDFKKKMGVEKREFAAIKAAVPARLSECQKIVAELSGVDFTAVAEEVAAMELEADTLAAQIQPVASDKTAQQRKDLANLEYQISQDEAQVRRCQANIAATEKSIEESRSRWISVSMETFTGANCPTCGRELPGDQLKAATESFERSKQSRLQEIERTAASQKATKEQAESQCARIGHRIQTYRAAAESLRMALSSAAPVLDTSKRDRVAELRRLISEKYQLLGKRQTLEKTRSRIEELQREARESTGRLEAAEGLLFMADEYTRYKTGCVESSVNECFSLARFRLFKEQANGGIDERCDVVMDGIPYTGLNNGSKINVGIDIINTLSRHFGVSVPLFVDNAESVTRLECAATQVIRLVVSEHDKELRCEYEN